MHELLSNAAPEADGDRLRPVLDAAMRELNERDREAVLLRFFEGRGFAEVGARLNLTENAARMRVDRALDKLRARLSEHGVTSTAAALALALANQAVVAAPAGLAATITGAALTGAAASGGAWAVLQFIATNKLPIGIVSAESPQYPPSRIPQSTETTSPSLSTRSPGMPWTTSSLTLMQVFPGKPFPGSYVGYHLNSPCPPADV